MSIRREERRSTPSKNRKDSSEKDRGKVSQSVGGSGQNIDFQSFGLTLELLYSYVKIVTTRWLNLLHTRHSCLPYGLHTSRKQVRKNLRTILRKKEMNEKEMYVEGNNLSRYYKTNEREMGMSERIRKRERGVYARIPLPTYLKRVFAFT